MITKLILKNYKSVVDQTYAFTDFDLLVGRNNSGKSTILQSLAIWQFCVEEFRRANRSGKTGLQVVLPNFTALPVPEFNLLWHEKVDGRPQRAIIQDGPSVYGGANGVRTAGTRLEALSRGGEDGGISENRLRAALLGTRALYLFACGIAILPWTRSKRSLRQTCSRTRFMRISTPFSSVCATHPKTLRPNRLRGSCITD